MIDQWALQAAAVDALDGFTELWTLKVGATHAPQRERIQQATPGPASPNGDNDLTLNLEMILLGSVVQDKQPDIPVGLHRLAAHAMAVTPAHGMAVVKSGVMCCELIKIYAYDISEKFDRAEELHDLLTDQARYLDRFVTGQYQKIHGDDTKLSDDPFLDATSLQRAVKLRGQEVLPETVRQWAMRGHVAISRSMTGKRTYRLADVMARIEAA